MHTFRRVAFAVIMTLLIGAVALAVLDLYLTGHGHPSLGRPWISWPAGGVALSRADVVLLAAVAAAGVTAWRRSRWT